jgi:hypothetical protein
MSPYDKQLLRTIIEMLLKSNELTPLGAREMIRIFHLEEAA